MSVDLTDNQSHPVYSRKGRIIQNRETVSTGFNRLLKPYWCQGVQSDPKPEADSVKTGNEEEDWADREFHRNNHGLDLSNNIRICIPSANNSITNHVLPARPRHDFRSGKECPHFTLEPFFFENNVRRTIDAVPRSLFEEEEHQNNRGTGKPNSPPILVIPGMVDSDEPREGRSGGSTQIHGDAQGIERATTLVEEEQVDEVQGAKYGNDVPEETCEELGCHEGIVLVWGSHIT